MSTQPIETAPLSEAGEDENSDEWPPEPLERSMWLRCLVVAGGTTEALEAFETLPLGPLFRQAPVNVIGGYLVDIGARTIGDRSAGPYQVIYPAPLFDEPPFWWPAVPEEWPPIEREGVLEYRVATQDVAPLGWVADASNRCPRLRIALLWTNDDEESIGQVRFIAGTCEFREEHVDPDDFHSFVDDQDGWDRWIREAGAWAAQSATLGLNR